MARNPPACPAEKKSLDKNLVTDRRVPCCVQVRLRTEAGKGLDFVYFEIFTWDRLASRIYAAAATPFHT